MVVFRHGHLPDAGPGTLRETSRVTGGIGGQGSRRNNHIYQSIRCLQAIPDHIAASSAPSLRVPIRSRGAINGRGSGATVASGGIPGFAVVRNSKKSARGSRSFESPGMGARLPGRQTGGSAARPSSRTPRGAVIFTDASGSGRGAPGSEGVSPAAGRRLTVAHARDARAAGSPACGPAHASSVRDEASFAPICVRRVPIRSRDAIRRGGNPCPESPGEPLAS